MTGGEIKTVEQEMTIKNRFGIHARPAALIVKTVSQFASDVTISREEMIASGKSIMGLLTLEGYQGAVLKVTAVGPDADEVIAALQDLVESKFFED
ncbi:MAG: HPr family phosphocarrier protein [Kiritimatiellae bacterium]|nr:HPr family phosphocarrier protein [Kiritimatiellia bacterium]MCB1102976.1 HPr family phosphocarrier protein [Kiritimatiellia bacterium]